MYHFGKGVDYYLMNHLFIMKLSAFAIVGVLSIYPTITFLKARKIKEDKIQLENFKPIKLIILFKITILPIIPFLAVLVTNGLGI